MADTPRKGGFNTAAHKETKSTPPKDYTPKEVMDKTTNMIAAARTPEQRKVIYDLQQGYKTAREKKEASRNDRNLKFAMGIRKGLHQNKTLTDLQRSDKIQDQFDSREVMREAKGYYHRNYSLRKTYRAKMRKDALKGKAKDAMNKARDKDQDMDMGE